VLAGLTDVSAIPAASSRLRQGSDHLARVTPRQAGWALIGEKARDTM
jgi:hypothetical protein